MRRMSFAKTTEAVRKQSKTVTRRFGWLDLKPGDLVQPVEKVMGLKKGEKHVLIGGPIRVLKTRPEPLWRMPKADCAKEGFPDMTPEEFIEMIRRHYNCSANATMNRIEFEYTQPSSRYRDGG